MKKLIYNNQKQVIDDLLAKGEVNLDRNVIEILINRGYKTSKEINEFMNLSMDNLHNPLLLPDAEKACLKLIEYRDKQEEVTIFGDYDVDGAMGTSVLFNSLKKLGFKVNAWTNNRFVEGYGINPLGVENMLKKFPNTKLVLTVDNGIVAYDGVEACNKLGIEVIVTDHHDANEELPKAYAVVNPKRKDSKYPFRELCGTGVAFKVMLLLYFMLNEDLDFVYDMLDMVSLATVADIVPLIDENRIIVKEGLSKVRSENRAIFRIFREITKVTNINTYTFGFVYGPMINAIGRLEGGQLETIEAFTSNDELFIEEVINKLFNLNEKRKEMTELQMNICEDELSKNGEIPEVIFVYNKDFHEGVVGLIAGRLKEKYCRPTFVLTEHNGVFKGSARSIDNYHIKEVLDMIKDDLLGYGGHAKAGGVSVSSEKLEVVKEKLINIAKEKLTPDDYIPKLTIDTVLDANNISIHDIEQFDLLEPYGEGFSKPLFGLNNFEGVEYKFIGDKHQHVKIKGKNIDILGFNLGETYEKMGCPLYVKVVGHPSINTFNNIQSTQFIIDHEIIKRYK